MASKGRGGMEWRSGRKKELARLHSNSQSPGWEDGLSGQGRLRVTAAGRTGAWRGAGHLRPARVGATRGDATRTPGAQDTRSIVPRARRRGLAGRDRETWAPARPGRPPAPLSGPRAMARSLREPPPGRVAGSIWPPSGPSVPSVPSIPFPFRALPSLQAAPVRRSVRLAWRATSGHRLGWTHEGCPAVQGSCFQSWFCSWCSQVSDPGRGRRTRGEGQGWGPPSPGAPLGDAPGAQSWCGPGALGPSSPPARGLVWVLSSQVPSLFFTSLFLSAHSNLEPPTPHLVGRGTLWITEHCPVVSVSTTPESGWSEATGWEENTF